MSEIDAYVRILYLRLISQVMTAEGHYRREEVEDSIKSDIDEVLFANEGTDITDVQLFSENFVDELIRDGALIEEKKRFAGSYLVYVQNKYAIFRDQTLKNSDIAKDARRIGQRYFPDVFSGFRIEREGGSEIIPDLGVAPASNRVVTFSDNQIDELDEKSTEIIDVVSAQNQIAETPGLRELIVGQLKAGRELVRAGSFRLYVFDLTMIKTLQFLAKRYENEIIGGLAAALITALLKHIGLDC